MSLLVAATTGVCANSQKQSRKVEAYIYVVVSMDMCEALSERIGHVFALLKLLRSAIISH